MCSSNLGSSLYFVCYLHPQVIHAAFCRHPNFVWYTMSRDLTTAKDFTIEEAAATLEQNIYLSTENVGPCVKDGAHDQMQFLIRQGAKRNLSQNLTIGLFRKYLLERTQQYMQFRDGQVLKEAQVHMRLQPNNCQGLLPNYQNTSRKPSFLERRMLPKLRYVICRISSIHLVSLHIYLIGGVINLTLWTPVLDMQRYRN